MVRQLAWDSLALRAEPVDGLLDTPESSVTSIEGTRDDDAWWSETEPVSVGVEM
jgi:hypothetical protein